MCRIMRKRNRNQAVNGSSFTLNQIKARKLTELEWRCEQVLNHFSSLYNRLLLLLLALLLSSVVVRSWSWTLENEIERMDGKFWKKWSDYEHELCCWMILRLRDFCSVPRFMMKRRRRVMNNGSPYLRRVIWIYRVHFSVFKFTWNSIEMQS